MIEVSILKYPDFTKLFILYINISKRGVGIILTQYDEEVKADYIVEYFSHSLE